MASIRALSQRLDFDFWCTIQVMIVVDGPVVG